MMKNKWRMPHPATMFLLLTMAVVFLSWICDIYGLKVTLPQTGEDIRVPVSYTHLTLPTIA